MSDKNKKRTEEELDMQTTFADMNVEGFSWYDSGKKHGKQTAKPSKKEYWAMVRAAYAAYLPLFGVIAVVGVMIYLLARLWLG